MNGIDIEKMNSEIDMVKIGKWFEERYGKSFVDFKNEIANKSIDFVGNRKNATLIVDANREGSIYISVHTDATEVSLYTDGYRALFPIYSVLDFADYNILQELYIYEQLNQKPEVMPRKRLTVEETEKKLTSLFIEHNFKNFNEYFNSYISGLYKWVNEEME